jgi:hypothetical protein
MESDKTPGSWDWLREHNNLNLDVISLAQSVGLLIDSQRRLAQSVDRLEQTFHAEMGDLRDDLIDLDHKHAATRQVLNALQEDGA